MILTYLYIVSHSWGALCLHLHTGLRARGWVFVCVGASESRGEPLSCVLPLPLPAFSLFFPLSLAPLAFRLPRSSRLGASPSCNILMWAFRVRVLVAFEQPIAPDFDHLSLPLLC
ncbi:hypothetical protein, unlikely [Trypanosoma brucei gambiense DAL972]|uniref:Uncharacterized protein n=1 Tax=Trypanosoma brucei gambiense (strain MHOM/CI/86/DAL972) TaxID=679716 RepID=C9ZSP1_TRYB9|nr:hypothetical protein, unlikely [Trypanosoma brucei gambiense DAL972]CBH12425.1 hypothetical protein, unlikely [Trypanosoma brucei gambiense DAL972]|eukprot:XP_011774706.1 hypothetical protein, unlikely [Trypanosoma brucei gambiense DAL972]